VAVHGAIGLTDRTKPEVVAPALQHQVELPDKFFRLFPAGLSSGHLTDLLTQSGHPFLRGFGSDIGPSGLCAVAAPQRITQEVKRLLRYPADAGLLLIYLYIIVLLSRFHDYFGLFSAPAAQNHKFVCIVDDASLQLLFPAQCLPSKKEASHVQIGQQRRNGCPLRGASATVLVYGSTLFVSFAVLFFHRHLQP